MPKDRTFTPKHPNKVQLRQVPTSLLRKAYHFMVSEVEASNNPDGICPEERPVYVALALTCARELRRRKKRVPCGLPDPPEAK